MRLSGYPSDIEQPPRDEVVLEDPPRDEGAVEPASHDPTLLWLGIGTSGGAAIALVTGIALALDAQSRVSSLAADVPDGRQRAAAKRRAASTPRERRPTAREPPT